MSEQTAIIQPAAVAAKIAADAPRVPEKSAPKPPGPESAPKPETAPETARPALTHNGRAYDPERYRLNADGTLFLNRHGFPMPRGGRKARRGAVAAGGAAAAEPSAAAASVWTAEERAAAAAAQPPAGNGPETGNGAETGNGPETPAACGGNGAAPEASARAVAEVVTHAGYALTGVLIGDAKAARPTPAEHANLRDTGAAYIEARGLRFIGGLAVCVCVGAYLLGETRRAAIAEAVKNLAGKVRGRREKNVTPVAPPRAYENVTPVAPPRAYEKVPPVAHEMPGASPVEVPPAPSSAMPEACRV